jgi:hypothetical protein
MAPGSLETVVAGDCFQAGELPPPPAHIRRPPKAQAFVGSLFDARMAAKLNSA